MGRLISTQLALAEADRTRQALVRARTVALRAQISPHFAYNTLTAIAAMVRRNPEGARHLLVKFAEFSRYILQNDRINTTLADELRNIHAYLELERSRRPELEVVFRIDPGVLGVIVPMLILQPLVENAVQHGIEHKDGGAIVTLVAEDRDEEVFVSVSDNGIGIPPETRDSILAYDTEGGNGRVGLANVRDRLRLTYGERYRLSIESAPGEGTTGPPCRVARRQRRTW